jgi:hypothetical protein
MPIDPNEPVARRPRASRNANTGFPVGPALAVVALLGFGYFGSQMIAKGSNVPAPAEAPAHVPFSSVPEESPPDISNRPGMRWVNNAPADLALSSSAFATARTLAAKGEQHLADARSADAAGNSDESRAQRKAAKVAYDTAFTDTAGWEMELLAAYTDKDRQVRDIQRERTRWMDKIIALHKTTGR